MRTREQAILIREGRAKVGLTQFELGNVLKVDKQFISNFERGLAHVPAKHVKKLSKTLKIPVKRFVEAYVLDEAREYKRRIK